MGKKAKVLLYDKNVSNSYLENYDGKVLDNIVTKVVTKENLTGTYEADMSVVLDEDKLFEEIENESVIKLLMDYGYEYFVATDVKPSLTGKDIVLVQITKQESQHAWIEDTRPTTCSGTMAMSILQNKMDLNGRESRLQLYSDISNNNTAYYEKLTIDQCLYDCDQSFINRWGGETQRRGFKLSILNHIGNDKGLYIEYAKNLMEFDYDKNLENLCTMAQGKGYNGIYGNWIKSSNIDAYRNVYRKIFPYDDVKVKDENMTTSDTDDGMIFDTLEEAQAELDKRVKKEFSENHVDQIHGTFNIKHKNLENTDQYKAYRCLEKAYIGDIIHINVPKLNCTLDVRVIERQYNILTQEYESLVLSNEPISNSNNSTFSTVVQGLENLNKTTINNLAAAKQFATKLMQNGLKDSYVVARENEILIGDHPKIEDMVKVWRWNANGLGYSSTGYNGNYGTAITSDGKIVADFITAGTLSAITIVSNDGSFKLDLSTGGGCAFYNNNKLALKIYNNLMEFYNWGTGGDYIGSLGSTTRNGETSGIPFVEMWHNPDKSAISFGYKDKDTGFIKPYIRLDKGMLDNTKSPIQFDEAVTMFNQFDMNNFGLFLDKTNYPNLYLTTSTAGWVWCNGSFIASGDLGCKGNKPCIQETENFGNVPFYATEDLDSYLTWTTKNGEYLETKSSKNGDCCNCIVKIPQIVQEGINTKMQYDITYYKYGEGDIWTSKITEKFFIVHSNKPIKFRFTLRGMRKNFENSNLENTLKNSEQQLKDKANKLYLLDLWKRCGQEWEEYGRCIDD